MSELFRTEFDWGWSLQKVSCLPPCHSNPTLANRSPAKRSPANLSPANNSQANLSPANSSLINSRNSSRQGSHTPTSASNRSEGPHISTKVSLIPRTVSAVKHPTQSGPKATTATRDMAATHNELFSFLYCPLITVVSALWVTIK